MLIVLHMFKPQAEQLYHMLVIETVEHLPTLLAAADDALQAQATQLM
jgi:hypothetical protein